MSQTIPPPPPTGAPAPPPTAPAGGAAAIPPKKGLPIWAWIGLGCGCLVVLGFVVVGILLIVGGKQAVGFLERMDEDPSAAAELFVKLNPDLELVESDAESGKITIRDKETGEVGTFDYSDIANGNFSFEGSDGSTFNVRGEEGTAEFTDSEGNRSRAGVGQSLEDLPGWLHLYPDSDIEVGYTQQGENSASGLVSQVTDDTVTEVSEHFADYFATQGWKVSRNQMSGDGQNVIILSARSEDGSTSQSVTVTKEGDEPTRIAVQYDGPAS